MARGPAPRPLFVIRLSYISFFTAPPQFNTYLKTLTFGSSSPPLATSPLRTNLGSRLLVFYSKAFLSHKSPSFENFRLRHIACYLRTAWASPIKNPGYAYARIQEIFLFGYFLSQPIKKQCCPRAENRTFSRTWRVRGQGQGHELRDQGLQNVSSRPRTSSRTPPLPIFKNNENFHYYKHIR